jgi:hypothetical protein
VDEGIGRVADSQHGEGRREHAPSSEAVHEGTEHGAGTDADEGVRRDDQPRRPQPDPAHVVEVDEEEGKDDAVPEGVDEGPRLAA